MEFFIGYILKNHQADHREPGQIFSRIAKVSEGAGGVTKCTENFGFYGDPGNSAQMQGPFENERIYQVIAGSLFGDIPRNRMKPASREKFLTGVPGINEETADQLRGEFILVQYDKITGELLLVNDHFGTRPLYYLDLPEIFAFSSSMHGLKKLEYYEGSIDELWIADSILNLKSEPFKTPYAGMNKLTPASILRVKDRARISSYRNLHRIENADSGSPDEVIEKFGSLLEEAVNKRLNSARPVGTELSGGLDSSAVTSLVAKFCSEKDHPLFVFSATLSDENLGKIFPYRDEREFSREVAAFLGLENHLMVSGDREGILDALKQNILTQGGPTQQGFHLLSDTVYRAAGSHNVDLLFSGFGGDEGVSSRCRSYTDELIRTRNWSAYKSYIRQSNSPWNNHPLKNYLKFWIPALIPAMTGRQLFRRRQESFVLRKYRGFAPAKLFEQRLGLRDRYIEAKYRERDAGCRAEQVRRLSHSAVNQRLEYSFHAARAYGLTYTYPLLDIDLVGFFLDLPTSFKISASHDRLILREATKGMIPEQIRLRNDKTGTTVPSLQQRVLNDSEGILQLIERSRRNAMHYIDCDDMEAWLHRLTQRTGAGDPANPVGFLNSLQILLLQDMERNNEFKSGIPF